jgi:hypothetical protein
METPPTVARDVLRSLTNKTIAIVIDELKREETQRRIKEHIAEPVMKAMFAQLTPYILLVMVAFVAILASTMSTLVLSALFYFNRTKLR